MNMAILLGKILEVSECQKEPEKVENERSENFREV